MYTILKYNHRVVYQYMYTTVYACTYSYYYMLYEVHYIHITCIGQYNAHSTGVYASKQCNNGVYIYAGIYVLYVCTVATKIPVIKIYVICHSSLLRICYGRNCSSETPLAMALRQSWNETSMSYDRFTVYIIHNLCMCIYGRHHKYTMHQRTH
jgi:hypothetical protein